MTATVTHGVTATHVAVAVTYMFHMYVTITQMTVTVTHGVTATHVAVVVTYMFHMYVTITHECYRYTWCYRYSRCSCRYLYVSHVCNHYS